ncbi:MAG: site-specific DNA-methyltransferase, partial [Candidatus Magasanikbacteria bacterium]|nr:site-specific DNA-methyltransferase [Candidatus Magasanikbacteria bacterium]
IVWADVPEAFEDDVENKLPVLEEVPKLAIKSKDDKPTHVLIEGDNYHALTCLNYTHKGKVDVIYIDPPYNTGSDGFRYKDKRILDKFPDGTIVDKENPFRQSYWLSFMKKRLELAKDLLTNTGVVFISIDDNEVAQLKLLCDEILGSNNFVAQLVWAAGRKNDSKLISVSHEYILCYVKSIDLYKEKKIMWRTRKEGVDAIYKAYNRFKRKHKDDFKAIERDLKEWFSSLPNSDPAKRQSHYSCVDERGIYFPDNISWPGGGGPKYAVLHPKTKKACKVPSRGWMFASAKRMQEVIDDNRVHFGEDETKVPCIKSYLKDREFAVPYSVLYQDGRAATKRLREILDGDLFTNPKDEDVLSNLLNFSAPKNAKVLDFFAGSGTTAHAVLKLNDIDKGTRQFILITNNEGKIMSEVCYPRIKKIISGYGEHIGFGGSLKYYRTGFVGKHSI